jgi:hypothetical protein
MSFDFLSIFVSMTANMALRQVSQGSNGKKKREIQAYAYAGVCHPGL